jgi:hypothetical protein
MGLLDLLMQAPIDWRTLSYARLHSLLSTPIGIPSGGDGKGPKRWLHLDDDGNLVLNPLKYPRPDFTGWNVIDVLNTSQYKVNGGTTQSYSSTITLTSGQDYLIYLPTTVSIGRQNGITISGGRNIYIVGGELDFTNKLTAPFGWANYNQSDRRGFQLLNQSGDIWIEGTWVHGNQIGDGFWLNNDNANVKFITIQNTVVEGMSSEDLATQNAGNHPDCFQLIDQTTYANMTWRNYQVLGRTAYQGLTTNDTFKSLELERVHFDMQSVTNWDGSKSSGYAFGFFAGTSIGIDVIIGPEVEVRKDPGRASAGPMFPENMPGWQHIVYNTALTDPQWLSQIPTVGRTYKANMPQPEIIMTADQVDAAIAAHNADTTGVHGISDTAKLVMGVEYGTTTSTPRPTLPNGSPWPGIVLWSGTGAADPSNTAPGDLVVKP